MNAEQIQKISSLKELTGCSDSEAQFLLDASGWDLEIASQTFFSEESHSPPPSPAQLAPSPAPTTTSAPSSKQSSSNRSGGIKSFSDIRSEEKEDEDTVNWYAGGEKSGIQMQAPKKKDDLLNNIMDSAKKGGAVSADEFEKENNKFSGSGHRLGNQNMPSGGPIPQKKQEQRVKIIFWKNGFTVENSELRDYNDAGNRAFLDSIMKGQVPVELQQRGYDVLVDLVDSRKEDWKPTLKSFEAFTGSGQRLGSVSSSQSTSTSASTSKIEPVKVDESQPTTSIQIRCGDGSRLVGKFNHTNTVKDIRRYIDGTKPSKGSYDLCYSFPQKPITDESQTLLAANLLNAVVIQKIK